MNLRRRLMIYLCFGVFCGYGTARGAYNWSNNPGNGTADTPFQISTAEQVASIGSDPVLLDKKYFILMNDIDMSGYTFTNSPIAPQIDQSSSSYSSETKFSGSFDGRGHRISNLTITRSGTSYNIGFIGLTTGTTAQVKNLGLEAITISVGHLSETVGGIMARGFGATITDSYVTGSITGGDNVTKMGGLAGFASATELSNCYAMCTLTNGTGSSSTGGAVGYLTLGTSTLERCYSTGIVSSPSTASSIGALVGLVYNGPTVGDCYYLFGVGPNNGIGTPKYAYELQLIPTYTNWEFSGALLGNQGHWRMRSDMLDYPFLAWEFMQSDFYGDFQVDLLDYVELSQSWQKTPGVLGFNWLCDLNNNYVIDLEDFSLFCDEWLMVYQP